MGWPYRNSILAGLFYIQPLSIWIQCEAQANPTSRELQLCTKGLEDFGPQHHPLIDTLRKGSTNHLAMILCKALLQGTDLGVSPSAC
jgi:hypothetical protein